jgi:hypothetical protein
VCGKRLDDRPPRGIGEGCELAVGVRHHMVSQHLP